MNRLINRNSSLVWQSVALSALVIILLCSLVTFYELILLDNTFHALFVLSPVCALALVCSALLTASALFSWWRCNLVLLTGSIVVLGIGVILAAGNVATLFNDVSRVQLACWGLLLLGWVVWFSFKKGKAALLIINITLLLFCLYLVFFGGATAAMQLGSSPLTSVNSAIFTSLCAMANIGFCLAYPKKLQVQPTSLGLLLSVFIAVAVTLIWVSNTKTIQRHVKTEAEHLTQQIQRNLDNIVQAQRGLLIRLVKRAALLTDDMNAAYFQQEAQDYLSDFSYISYLAFTTANHSVRYSQAKTVAEQNEFDSYLVSRLATAKQDRFPSAGKASFFVDYNANIDHTWLYAVYRSDSTSAAMVAAANINYKTVLDNLVAASAPKDLRLIITQAQGGELLYQSEQQTTQCPNNIQRTLKLSDDVSWLLTVCKNLNAIPTGLLISSKIILYVGFMAMFLVLLSQQLQQKSRRHQLRLLSVNNKLRQSFRQQQRLQINQQHIMMNSADVICIVDANGCFIELSHSAEKVFGYPMAELIGKPFNQFVHLADRSISDAEAMSLKEGNDTLNFRNRYLRQDGSTVHLLWAARYVKELDIIYAIAHDVSELERQERLQASQRDILKLISVEGEISEIYNQICEMAQHHIPGVKASLSIAQKGRLKLAAAPAFTEQYRTIFAEIPISKHAVSCGMAAYQRSMVVCEDMMQNAAWQPFSEVIKDEAVTTCWSMPIQENCGNILGCFTLFSSETATPETDKRELMSLCCHLAGVAIEKMQQRQALQASEQHYRCLYEYNPDPVFTFDLTGNFLNLNHAGTQLLGCDEAQIVGLHFSKLIAAEQLLQVTNCFNSSLQGQVQQYETVVQVPDGSRLDLSITNLPILVDAQVVGVFGIAKNITERNKNARALQQSLSRLSLQSIALQGMNHCATGIHSDWNNPQMLRYVINELRRIMSCSQASVLITDASFDGAPMWYSSVAPGQPRLSEAQAYFLFNSIKRQCFDGMVFDNNTLRAVEGAEHQHELKVFLTDNHIAVSPVCDRDGRLIGCLMVTDSNSHQFYQDELLVITQFAKLLYSALEYRQLLQSELTVKHDLQRQLQFNQAVTNSMSDVLLVTDMTGNVTVLNPSAERLLAQCGIKLPYQLISEILPIDPTLWQQGNDYKSELELCTEQQSLSYISKVMPLKTHDQQVGWLVTLHDISAQRRADAISLERDQFFTLSLELFCLVDLEGCFVQVNPAFSRVLEYPVADLIEQPYLSVIDTQDHQLIIDAVLTLRQGIDIHDLEFRVISRSGKLCWLQLSAALSGDIIFCAARDITARKASQEQLEHTLHELQRSNAELNEFAYVASHDLQEPLRKIRTFGERLQQKLSNEDTKVLDYVGRMQGAAERMQNLINDLLSYSRLNATQIIRTEVNMSLLLQDVLSVLDDAISASGAIIATDITANIVGDERQLRQLLQNLLSNAIKFHQSGQAPQITVATEQLTDSVRLTVADQGIGFDPQFIDKIFNPFQRLHKRSEFAGTGIGLAIVKKIAERHGAVVNVVATVGEGARFQISFPIAKADNSKTPIPAVTFGVDYA